MGHDHVCTCRGIGMRGQVVILVSDTWSITCRPDLIILAVIFRELNETSSDYSGNARMRCLGRPVQVGDVRARLTYNVHWKRA